VANHVFEVDVFTADNEGLVIAEVELNREKQPFTSPNWLGKEVTGEAKYYNSQLSKKPYKQW
jgi:CYTH domain-containing protein